MFGASLVGCSTTKAQSKNLSTDDVTQIVSSSIDLANEYCNLGMYEDALTVYDKALDNVNDYRLIYNKALVLAYMERYDEAIELCKESFKLFPYVISFKKAQAFFYEKLGNLDLAYFTYDEILELNPYDKETRFALIELYSNNEEFEKAREQAEILWNQGYKTLKVLDVLDL